MKLEVRDVLNIIDYIFCNDPFEKCQKLFGSQFNEFMFIIPLYITNSNDPNVHRYINRMILPFNLSMPFGFNKLIFWTRFVLAKNENDSKLLAQRYSAKLRCALTDYEFSKLKLSNDIDNIYNFLVVELEYFSHTFPHCICMISKDGINVKTCQKIMMNFLESFRKDGNEE